MLRFKTVYRNLFLSTILSGAFLPASFADLSCTSIWMEDQKSGHCHITVAHSASKTIVCTETMSIEAVSTQSKCEALCTEANSELRQEALEHSLVLSNNLIRSQREETAFIYAHEVQKLKREIEDLNRKSDPKGKSQKSTASTWDPYFPW